MNQLEVILLFDRSSLKIIALFIMVSSAEGSFSMKLLASIVEIIAPFEVSSDAKLPRLSIEIVL